MQDTVFRFGATQKVAYTGTHGVIANAISAGINVIRVWTTTLAYIQIGTAPVATNADIPIPANTPVFIVVPSGGTMKVSAIQDAAGGNLFVTECSC